MWNALILYPFTNALLLLYSVVGNSFTLAIVIFTVLIRLVTIPLTVWAQKNQQRMTEMQPVMKELQEKYKDKPQELQAEMAKLGFGPTTMLGGCLPMLLQFPIMIGLYQSITHVMAVSPLTLIDLYHAIYPIFPNFDQLIPVNNHFFWLNLALPDPYYVLPALVVATTWLSQQMVTPAPAAGGDGGQAAEMARSMSLSTTVVFGFMSLQFASGLSIYFVVSNIATAVQYAWTNEYQRKRIIAFLKREPLPKPEVKKVTTSKGSKTGKALKAGAKK
jgi:YidC/Oxa1 family membrane protein insertase